MSTNFNLQLNLSPGTSEKVSKENYNSYIDEFNYFKLYEKSRWKKKKKVKREQLYDRYIPKRGNKKQRSDCKKTRKKKPKQKSNKKTKETDYEDLYL